MTDTTQRDRAVDRRHRCECHPRPRRRRRRSPDPLTQLTDALSRSPLENIQRTLRDINDLVEQALAPLTDDRTRTCDCGDEHDHHHEHCGCEHPPGKHRHTDHACGCGECHCRCCIGDVDLVIYSRLGEHRVVPIAIHNPRKRVKQVELQLSGWETRGGKRDIEVVARLDRNEVDLGPCASETVVLTVATPQESERTEDVDDCTVYVADLRLEGCGVRPLRIALALLPRDCSAHDVHCDCSCC